MSKSESKIQLNGSILNRHAETHKKKPYALNSMYYYNRLHKFRNKKFLVVEDDETCIVMTTPILESWNVSFDIARDGKQALEILDNNSYDIALLDINLPFYSGIDIANKLKKNKRHRNHNTILIAITSNNAPKILERIIKSGISSYLIKPVNRDLLYEDILRCIDNKEIIAG